MIERTPEGDGRPRPWSDIGPSPTPGCTTTSGCSRRASAGRSPSGTWMRLPEDTPGPRAGGSTVSVSGGTCGVVGKGRGSAPTATPDNITTPSTPRRRIPMFLLLNSGDRERAELRRLLSGSICTHPCLFLIDFSQGLRAEELLSPALAGALLSGTSRTASPACPIRRPGGKPPLPAPRATPADRPSLRAPAVGCHWPRAAER
jgi:hypothetical protein